jgi:hypothetical protein
MTRIERRPARSLWWLAFPLLGGGVALSAGPVLVQNRLDSPEAYFIENVVRRHEAAALLRAGRPRILITGGSSSLFGLDAEWIERSLGAPRREMGSHSGLERLLARSMRLERRRRIACVDPGGVYDSNLASPNGDFRRFPEVKRPLDDPNIQSGVREGAWRIPAAFAEECRRRSVRVMATLPAFAADEPERPAIEAWLNGIGKRYRAAGLEVLEHAGEVLYSTAEFTDTRSHPRPLIRRLKTGRIIERLGGRPAPPEARAAGPSAGAFRPIHAGRLIAGCGDGAPRAPLATGWVAEYRVACRGAQITVNGHAYPRPENGETLIAIDTAAGVIVDFASFDAAGRPAGWTLSRWLEEER